MEKLKDVTSEIKALRRGPVHDKPTPPDIDMVAATISKLCVEGRRAWREHAVLSNLSFAQRTLRHASILDAHRKTFEWVFRDVEIVGNDNLFRFTTSLAPDDDAFGVIDTDSDV